MLSPSAGRMLPRWEAADWEPQDQDWLQYEHSTRLQEELGKDDICITKDEASHLDNNSTEKLLCYRWGSSDRQSL